MILVDADALDLDRLVVEEQALVGIPARGAEAGFILVFVDQFAVLQQLRMDGIEVAADRCDHSFGSLTVMAAVATACRSDGDAGGHFRRLHHRARGILQFTDDLDRGIVMADIIERDLQRNLPATRHSFTGKP